MFASLMVEGARYTQLVIQKVSALKMLDSAWAAGFSAFGCGAADFEYRYDKTLDLNVAERSEDSRIILSTGKELQSAWDELKTKVTDEFEKNDHAQEAVDFRLLYRMQYQGQLNDLKLRLRSLGLIELMIGKILLRHLKKHILASMPNRLFHLN